MEGGRRAGWPAAGQKSRWNGGIGREGQRQREGGCMEKTERRAPPAMPCFNRSLSQLIEQASCRGMTVRLSEILNCPVEFISLVELHASCRGITVRAIS